MGVDRHGKMRMIIHTLLTITGNNHHFSPFPPLTEVLAGVLWLQSCGWCILLCIKGITCGLLSISSQAGSRDPQHFQAVGYPFVALLNHVIQHTTSVNHFHLPGGKWQVERSNWPQEELPSAGDKEVFGAFVSWGYFVVLCSHIPGLRGFRTVISLLSVVGE